MMLMKKEKQIFDQINKNFEMVKYLIFVKNGNKFY